MLSLWRTAKPKPARGRTLNERLIDFTGGGEPVSTVRKGVPEAFREGFARGAVRPPLPLRHTSSTRPKRRARACREPGTR